MQYSLLSFLGLSSHQIFFICYSGHHHKERHPKHVCWCRLSSPWKNGAEFSFWLDSESFYRRSIAELVHAMANKAAARDNRFRIHHRRPPVTFPDPISHLVYRSGCLSANFMLQDHYKRPLRGGPITRDGAQARGPDKVQRTRRRRRPRMRPRGIRPRRTCSPRTRLLPAVSAPY